VQRVLEGGEAAAGEDCVMDMDEFMAEAKKAYEANSREIDGMIDELGRPVMLAYEALAHARMLEVSVEVMEGLGTSRENKKAAKELARDSRAEAEEASGLPSACTGRPSRQLWRGHDERKGHARVPDY